MKKTDFTNSEKDEFVEKLSHLFEIWKKNIYIKGIELKMEIKSNQIIHFHIDAYYKDKKMMIIHCHVQDLSNILIFNNFSTEIRRSIVNVDELINAIDLTINSSHCNKRLISLRDS